MNVSSSLRGRRILRIATILRKRKSFKLRPESLSYSFWPKISLALKILRAYIRSCRDVPTVFEERDRQFSLATRELWKSSGETPSLRSGIQARGRRKPLPRERRRKDDEQRARCAADSLVDCGLRSLLWGGDSGGPEDIRSARLLRRCGSHLADGAEHARRRDCPQHTERGMAGATRCAGEGLRHRRGQDRDAGQSRKRWRGSGIP